MFKGVRSSILLLIDLSDLVKSILQPKFEYLKIESIHFYLNGVKFFIYFLTSIHLHVALYSILLL